MIDLDNEKIAEILFYYIFHEELDAGFINPILNPYEENENLHEILSNVALDIAEIFFKQGYLLAKQ